MVRCPNCGLVFQHPQPTDHELAKTYYQDPQYTELLFTVLRQRTVDLAEQKLALLRRLDLGSPSGRALDVGCSSGAWLELLARRGCDVVGVEIGDATAAAARERTSLDIRTGTLAEVGDSLGLTFDLITFWDVLEHLRDPEAELRRACGLMAPGATLALTCPNVGGWFPRLTYRLLARSIGVWEYPELPVHLYDFEPRTLKRLLEKCGFGSVRTLTFATNFDHYRGASLSFDRIGRGPRAMAVRAAYELLHLLVYPLARVFDRGNSMITVATCRPAAA
jgi:2-polyprenyl-3-methyl-5-hydroxy-6-metoxy-1,4-benzoquinol methylase